LIVFSCIAIGYLKGFSLLTQWLKFKEIDTAHACMEATGDYEEIMNKASCLSLVSNVILYWNTRN